MKGIVFMRSPRAWPSLSVPAVLFFLLGFAQAATTGQETAQRPRKPLDRIADLSLLREIKAELQGKGR
jgi:hypothetical protein